MPWRGPQYAGELPSLGWELIETWAEILPSPRDEQEPFILTDDQVWEIVEWYTLDPLTGQFVYRRGMTRRSKGSGKSPIEAAKCISELALPVRFDGWNADGEPVGRPWGTKGDPLPWVQIAALSEGQDENTYTPLYTFLTANDGKAADLLRVDAGLTRCFLRDKPGAKLEPVTSRAGSREGQPVTYGCLDETGYMTRENGGVLLARTIRRNTGKIGGRSHETTNGYIPGVGSVAEQTEKAALNGPGGIYLNAVEAPERVTVKGVEHEVTEDAPDEVLRAALAVAYGAAAEGHVSSTGAKGWAPLDRIVADIRDPDMPWEDAERFFFNWNRKGEGRAVDPKRWDEFEVVITGDPAPLAGEDWWKAGVQRGTRVGLGFDGSISDDSTALIACTADLFVWPLAIWERPVDAPDDWRVPRLDVRRVLGEVFDWFSVGRLYPDPPKWFTEIEEWQQRWNLPDATAETAVVLPFDTNQASKMAPACDRFMSELKKKAITHPDYDPYNPRDLRSVWRSHVLAMAKKKVRLKDDDNDGRTRHVFTKSLDGRKIDGGIATVEAVEAAAVMPEGPPAPAGASAKPGNSTGSLYRPKGRLPI